MAIDLGLDNLATVTFKEGNETYLFCGKKLKGINAFVNKKYKYDDYGDHAFWRVK